MLSVARTVRSRPVRTLLRARTAATQAASKREGDISDAFASLSGQQFTPLAPEYADLKARLIKGNEEAVRASWERLLKDLREEIPLIVEKGSEIIPEIDFRDIDDAPEEFSSELRKRGVAVVRGVVSEEEALGWKESLREYIRANPQTRAFPAENPQVFELYWSRAQLLARGHPNMLKAQSFLMSYWHATNPHTPISTRHPISYADRLRMRLPGDARFALGPHVDGGSVERWDEAGYGRGKVYDAVWKGNWEAFDPWESSCRLNVVSDLHQGVGACSAFRMFQGWLSLSTTGPGEGTLLVNPLLAKATAYYLLRPFFSPKHGVATPGAQTADEATTSSASFLASDNWKMDTTSTSWIHGASPGHGQELSHLLHPHLHLKQSMVHVPTVRPGDYVAWHCDTIHAVDRTHAGNSDSSVMYIPACPLTEDNAKYLNRQRSCFVDGTPSPDFGGGEGESKHVGRIGVDELENLVGEEGRRGMGLEMWDSSEEGLSMGERVVLDRANKVGGWYDPEVEISR
ncbi:hypothetical protein DPSP01_007086 [Paraphaeosphaeria sporulosa]|uniref:DUF1479-domain-containing protein n=1 Tax=Paraphaeosphaeria sporulosa TaxID=1460663 RepID=A0A177CDZ9_9PLEO|nr:DUF1479-domain-containing protein [Paraphaeosphaeria sporulosa]OAG05853.1 DUF1479-domain-containing protein [Paraphaeosphaeria sporulosa]